MLHPHENFIFEITMVLNLESQQYNVIKSNQIPITYDFVISGNIIKNLWHTNSSSYMFIKAENDNC